MNASRLTTPKEEVQELQEKLGHAARRTTSVKFHALYDKVYRWVVLCEAWKRVKAKKGTAGVDAVTLAEIEEHGVTRFFKSCERELKEVNYHPQPVRRHYILKKDGKRRPTESYRWRPNSSLNPSSKHFEEASF